VVISCIVFHHVLAPVAVVGILVIFVALFLKIYWRFQLETKKKNLATGSKRTKVCVV
jgi:hypothetical protein